MQVRIIIFRHTLWYNSLGVLTRQHEVDFFVTIYTLQIIVSISPKSICREFISPVGYFFDQGVRWKICQILKRVGGGELFVIGKHF